MILVQIIIQWIEGLSYHYLLHWILQKCFLECRSKMKQFIIKLMILDILCEEVRYRLQ